MKMRRNGAMSCVFAMFSTQAIRTDTVDLNDIHTKIQFSQNETSALTSSNYIHKSDNKRKDFIQQFN